MDYKDIFEFQEKYKTEEERVNALMDMSESEVNALIDTCRSDQAKIDYHNLYVVSQILKAEIPEKELDIFDENWSETEYRGMILYSLMHYMSWPEFRGNYTNSNETITLRELYFEEAFEHHESPNSAATEIGYGCG